MKPYLHRYSENEWEFIYPEEISSEAAYKKFTEGLENLDYNDAVSEKIFKSLIEKTPFYIDAYNHLSLAFKNQNKRFESFITAEKAYSIGHSFFPKEFKKKKDKLPWINLENRPFLRACLILGLEYQERKDYKAAINLYDEILLLNELDNQGARFLKLECLFANGDFKAAKLLVDGPTEDWSTEITYGKVAVEVLRGEIETAQKHLAKALKVNRFVPAEIVKTKHTAPPPHRIPGEPNYDAGIPMGSIQEAFEYWKRNMDLYKNKQIVDFYKNLKV